MVSSTNQKEGVALLLSGVIKLAPEDLLDKRDPLRKAERAKVRAENSPSSGKEASAEVETEAAEAVAVSGPASPGNGDHSEDNLTLRCRRHNQAAAEQELGTGFMTQARKRPAGAASLAI